MKKRNASGLILGLTLVQLLSTSDALSGTQFSVGLVAQGYTYREPGLMKFEGGLSGLTADFTYLFSNAFFMNLENRMLWGRADYTSNGTGNDKNIKQFIYEGRALIGRDYVVNCKATLSPYIGLGYRYKSDYSGGRRTTTGHWGYDRVSEYVYVPVGLKGRFALNASWDLTARAEYDFFLGGRQQSHFERPYELIAHHQHKGYGMKADVNFVKKIDTKRSFSFGPYVYCWNIKDSNQVYSRTRHDHYIEPKNDTVEAGISLKYTF